MINPAIFRSYDIRGKVPKEVDEDGFRKIALAIYEIYKPRAIQLGHDMRDSSPALSNALKETFLSLGVNVFNLGLVSTDMLYFAAGKHEADLSMTVSASHNTKLYNGLKIVGKGGAPLEKGAIQNIGKVAQSSYLPKNKFENGSENTRETLHEFVEHVMGFIDDKNIRPLNVVVDTGNGMSGLYMPEIEKRLPINVYRLDYPLDGSFPHHTPNPMKIGNARHAMEHVKAVSADMGIVFDGDGDRVFFIDETGELLSSTVSGSVLADYLLEKNTGEAVIYDSVIGKVFAESAIQSGGQAIRSKVGHTSVKACMREQNALFAAEHSGHYYYRDNFYADSGIIAALLMLQIVSIKNQKLSSIALKYKKYIRSGEINFETSNKDNLLSEIKEKYEQQAKIDTLDGVTIWADKWWASIRPSGTEPLIRLNIEADSADELESIREELFKTLLSLGAKEAV